SDTLSILVGIGDGTFADPHNIPADFGPKAIIAEDFDGDGNLDIALANEVSDAVMVLMGDGAGMFQPGRYFYSGDYCWALTAGDFNGDGAVDIFAANRFSYSLSLFLNQRGPRPSCPPDLTGDNTINLADLNLVLANFGSSTADGDTNDDGVVDLADLNAVLAAFGTDCP
ncbi:MAG: FG-GAP-like repeat-containing protein, partial [Phycisphaerales bacterium JB065]